MLLTATAGRAQEPDVPRLVVVVVVDQLRADYLDRFGPVLREGGFARFTEAGARFTQARYAHAIALTCAGHATVLTGTHANDHGIIANEWWNLAEGRKEYCARDDGSPLVGVQLEGRSPKNLIGSTVGDVLKLSNGGASRVVAVAGKDRSAIMLGGRSADAAYWMEDSLFVTSRWYMDALPAWVERFNGSGRATWYFGKTWDRVLPAEAYAMQGVDDAPWERDKAGMGRAFPHVLGTTEPRPGPDYFEALEYSPFQNELVMELAMEAVRNEPLGADDVPDILGIALSSNDYVGHAFGPDSHEVLDVTVRTDRLLARLFEFLDETVGPDRYVAVLTSDHGVAPIPEYVQANFPGLGALRLTSTTVADAVESALRGRLGAPPAGRWLAFVDGPYIYLDEAAVNAHGTPIEEAEWLAATAVERVPGVRIAHTRTDLMRRRREGETDPVVLSFHPARSGHVLYIPEPYVVEEDAPDGTTHGTPWSYDVAVPVAFHGAGIRAGRFHDAVHVADIAPTLAALLRIDRPAGARGRALTEALR